MTGTQLSGKAMTDSDIKQILHREASLNTVSVRAVPGTVLAILDEDFVEIDSTGRIWDAPGVAAALARNPEPRWRHGKHPGGPALG